MAEGAAYSAALAGGETIFRKSSWLPESISSSRWILRQPKHPNTRDASKKKTFLHHVQPLANSDSSSVSVDLPGRGTLVSSLCARVSEVSVCSKSDPGNLDVLEESYFMWLSWNQLALNHSFQGCVWHIV